MVEKIVYKFDSFCSNSVEQIGWQEVGKKNDR